MPGGDDTRSNPSLRSRKSNLSKSDLSGFFARRDKSPDHMDEVLSKYTQASKANSRASRTSSYLKFLNNKQKEN